VTTEQQQGAPGAADQAAEERSEFEYVAMDGAGRELRGTIPATDDVEAVTKLKKQGLFPIEVWRAKQKRPRAKKSKDRAGRGPKGLPSREGSMQQFLRKIGMVTLIKTKVLCIFTRQLSTMLDAGLPLLLSLRTLQEQCGRSLRYRSLKKVLMDIVSKVEGGMSLSEALADHPKSFSKLYVGLVRAGEASGAMEEVLNRLAEYIEKSERMKKKVKAGMTSLDP